MQNFFLAILLVLTMYDRGHAQLGRSLQPCWVHLDKPFYVIDDIVGYQLYLPPEFAGEEANIQVILFDADGQAIWYNYQRSGGAISINGTLKLDHQLLTNWYYLSFRVWDENRATERVLIQVPLAIYNDQETISPNQVSQQEPTRLKDPVIVDNKDLTLSITISPAKPQAGEEVELTIKATNRRGKPVQADLSLSINDWSQLSASLAMGMDNLHASDSLRVVTPSFLTNDFYWQGILLDEDNQALPNMQLLAHSGEEVNRISSNERGHFLFQTKSKRKTYNLELSTPDGSPLNAQFMPQRGRLVMGKLFYTPAAFRYLEANRQRREIYKLSDVPFAPLSDVQQNQVSILNHQFVLEADNEAQQNNWTSNQTSAPMYPSWIWQPTLQTNKEGEVRFNYIQLEGKTAFRIDAAGQSTDGHRARTSLLYRPE